jgi:putative membrane protein
MLTRDEEIRIAEAVRDAEAKTAGEIVVVVARQAATYRSAAPIWAMIFALATPPILLSLTDWSAARIFTSQILVAVALNTLLSISRVRIHLVPRFIREARAHDAARREFLNRGLSRTSGRTGVLIYVAAAEHFAEVIADTGIADKAGSAAWEDIIAELIGAIRDNRAGDGLVAAVARTGAILAEHAPPAVSDRDELPNKVIQI